MRHSHGGADLAVDDSRRRTVGHVVGQEGFRPRGDVNRDEEVVGRALEQGVRQGDIRRAVRDGLVGD